MGIPIIPPGDSDEEYRIQPDKVWYSLWYVPQYPLAHLNGKLDKDVAERPWIMGLLADLRSRGQLLNPVVVWNHHPHRLTGKQPPWLLRAGSNRIWCAEQLGWTHVPALVSTDGPDNIPGVAVRIKPEELQSYFVDGGNAWANEHGWGLLRAKKPEVTYAQYIPTNTELSELRPTNHGSVKLINPLVDK